MTKQNQDPKSHNKPCTLCSTPRPVLVRCQIDESAKWHFVCPGKCWTSVSGGEIDAKGHEDRFPYYRYGGMWKNKHVDGPLSAKKPKKSKQKKKGVAEGEGEDDGDGKESAEEQSAEEPDAQDEAPGVPTGIEAESERMNA